MSRRVVFAVAFAVVVGAPAGALAQGSVEVSETGVPPIVDVSLVLAQLQAAPDQTGALPTYLREAVVPKANLSAGSKSTMLSLSAMTAAMQVLDVHSALKALDVGGAERNPVMSGVVANRGVFIAAKVGVAALTVFGIRRVAKRNKLAAIAMTVGINSTYAMIVRNNYRVAAR